jgi:flagellar hook assembly protein FlgD
VSLDIYNLKGQKVRNLLKAQTSAGFHELQWDGKNDFHQLVGSGMYLYKLTTTAGNHIRKMLLLK